MEYVFAFVGVVVAIALIQHVSLRWQLRRRPEQAPRRWPPISVLKPIKGADPGLYGNLMALARQDYPDFEIVVAIADATDPACEVVRRLRRAAPEVSVRLVTGTPDIGHNAKVSNLAYATAAARHEVLLVSDADVRPAPDYLRGMARALEGGADLVHSLLAPDGEDNLGAALDHAQLTSIAASVASVDRVLGHPCVIGKSMMFRRQDLEALGGWAAFKDVLAEDYYFGKAFIQRGRRVALASSPLRVHMPRRSVASFWARHLRWLHMRRSAAPAVFLLEPLLHPFTALAILGMAWPLVAVVVGLAMMGLEWDALRRLRGHAPSWWMVPLVPIKDVAVFAIWLVATVRQTVVWRGRRMRMMGGTRLQPAGEEGGAHRDARQLA